MAYWIDHAFVWLFAALSSLLFFFVITDGNILLSVPAAFATVVLFRWLLKKLPDKHLFCRRKQLRQIDGLIKKWALMEETSVIPEIKSYLPLLYPESAWPSVQLIQHYPDGEPLSANYLLELWHSHKNEDSLCLLCTGPISPAAAALLPELENPAVQLIDSRQMAHHLQKSSRPLPPTDKSHTKKERHRPFSICAAQFAHSVRPIRSGIYLLVFTALYLLTSSRFYLLSSLLFFIQLIIYFISRMIAGRSPA